MAAPLAEPADIESRWRPLSANEADIAPQLLEDASTLVRMRLPSVDDDIDSGDIPANIAASVVVGMVVRVLRNPDALRQETLGDHSRSFADRYLGMLYISNEDLERLSPSASHGAFTVHLPWGANL